MFETYLGGCLLMKLLFGLGFFQQEFSFTYKVHFDRYAYIDYTFFIDGTNFSFVCAENEYKEDVHDLDKRSRLRTKLILAEETWDRRVRTWQKQVDRLLRSDIPGTPESPSRTKLMSIRDELYKKKFSTKIFNSKDEFFNYALDKITEYMTDEEVIKYFKKL